jgi:hypothetical protein
MDSDNLRPIEVRARRAYELTRVRDAAVAFAPVILLVLGTALVGERVGYVLMFGAVLFMLGVGLLWYGRGIKRAVLPGLAAGLIPLAFALCAKHVHHACMGDACLAFCIPACFAGGVAAGIIIDFVTLRRANKVGFWMAASGVGLLTGAMGSVCSGVLGLVGLLVGFAASALPGLAVAMLGRRTSA